MAQLGRCWRCDRAASVPASEWPGPEPPVDRSRDCARAFAVPAPAPQRVRTVPVAAAKRHSSAARPELPDWLWRRVHSTLVACTAPDTDAIGPLRHFILPGDTSAADRTAVSISDSDG